MLTHLYLCGTIKKKQEIKEQRKGENKMEIIKHEDGTYSLFKMSKEAFASLIATLGFTCDNDIYGNVDIDNDKLKPVCKEALHTYNSIVKAVPHNYCDSIVTIIETVLEGEKK